MLVQMRQVLEVGDLTRAPQLSECRDVSVLQQVGQVRGQDVVVDVVAELKGEKQGEPRVVSVSAVATPLKHATSTNSQM